MTDEFDQVPHITPAQMKRAKPMAKMHGEAAISSFRRGPGRPKALAPKERVSLRLDPDVLASLKSIGPGWQGQVNDILRKLSIPSS
jgi:uncharacterized protein (DUF4415 family)